LELLYARLADRLGWGDQLGPIALNLVDALRDGAHEEFGRQAMALRDALAAEGIQHEARRVIAGLAIMRAESALARVYGVAVHELRRRLRYEANEAKRLHCFSWHMLDG